MKVYTDKETLRIAKRFHNTKRTYLLVNPLQAKHLPVSPALSLHMMHALGDKLSRKYPSARLVIGFAETATAIGAAVSECFGPGCAYIHTTREDIPAVGSWILFQEEHSHAVEQKLAADTLETLISATDTIIFVDDEISTGKTLINIIDQLKMRYAELSSKRIIAASLLNRVSEAHEKRMAEAGVISEYLVKLPEEDYSARVKDIRIREAAPAIPNALKMQKTPLPCDALQDPRTAVTAGSYRDNCFAAAKAFLSEFCADNCTSILVLGTEECMYPALCLGKLLEDSHPACRVRCHATTRSPIGISEDENYPVTSGSKLHSFYDHGRDTYIYRLDQYDAVIVVTDTQTDPLSALEDLAGALPEGSFPRLFCIQCGNVLWQEKK